MKRSIQAILLILVLACNSCSNRHSQSDIQKTELQKHLFLDVMYSDPYFPKEMTDDIKDVLVSLCLQIERLNPKDLEELYTLTHRATNKINEIEVKYGAKGFELETVAREDIAEDFDFIAKTYGFEADIEELIAPREW